MNLADVVLSERSRRQPSMGRIVATTVETGMCTVLLADGEVDARLADHLIKSGPVAAVVAGDAVALLPIGDTYLVVASVGSTAGSGGFATSLGANLLPNPSFEFGNTDAPDNWAAWPWLSNGATSTRDTAPGESLSGSARVLQTLPPAGGTNVYALTWTALPVLVDPGATYRVAAWLKASVAAPGLSCVLRVQTGAEDADTVPFGAGTVLDAATVTAPGGAYQRIFGDVTIPAGHTVARLYLRTDSTHAVELSVSWDEAAFQQRITAARSF